MQKSSFYIMLIVGLGLLGMVLLLFSFSMGGRISP